MAQRETIQDLLKDEIMDLYSAEKQLIQALPKMAASASGDGLKEAFESHLEETKLQAQRLEQVAEMLGFSPNGKTCKGMQGVIAEGEEALKADGDEVIGDLGLIGAASRVEHYEMAGYITAVALAEQLGHTEAASLLNESLEEEMAAEDTLRAQAAELMGEGEDSGSSTFDEDDLEAEDDTENVDNSRVKITAL